MSSNMLDDRLMLGLFVASVIAYVILCIWCWYKKKKICKDFMAFVMYFIAFGLGLSFIVHILCSVVPCCQEILALTKPKLDTKFLILGGAAMLQYGFTGLNKTIKSHSD